MKKPFVNSLLIIASLLGFFAHLGASERWETLRAINWVENPTNQTKVGRFGELGPYQFRPATWKMHTEKPFRLAVNREQSDEVAVMHYEWIKRAFEEAGVEVNPFNIALAWNSGVQAVLSGRSPAASYSYAERVNNLVETFREGRRSLGEQNAVSLEDKSKASPFPVMVDGPQFRILLDPPRFVIAG